MRTKHILLSVLILFFFVGDIYAGGADLNVIPGAKTLALDGLYFAGGNGLNSVLGNPAGLIKISNKYLELNIADIIGQQKFEGDTKGLHKSYKDDHFALGGGLAWSFSPNFIMALSYQRAINYNVNWPFIALQKSDSAFSVSAFELHNRIMVNAASVSGAIRFNKITLGVSLSAYQLEQETAFPRENPLWYDSVSVGLASYQFQYKEDAWTFGFGAGILFEVSNNLQVGIMARSGYSADLSGTAQSNMFGDIDSVTVSKVNLSSKYEIPWVFGAGLVFNLQENLKINIDLQYSLWGSTQKSINYSFNNPVWQNGLSDYDSLTGLRGDKLILDYNNSIDAGIGLDYLLDNINLRAGYRFSQSPNSSSTYSYLFPSVNQNWITIGLGYSDENFTADLGLAYAFGVNKNITGTKTNFDGTYDSNLVLPTITIRYTL